jgi:hypothetical protein
VVEKMPGFTNGICNACGETESKHIQSKKSNMLNKRGQAVPCGNNIPVGWQPACTCGLDPVPGIVIDPFMGSGTTALVAERLGRHWLGIELNPKYIDLAEQRVAQQSLLKGIVG